MNPSERQSLNKQLDDFMYEEVLNKRLFRFEEKDRVQAVYECQFIRGQGEFMYI